MADAEKSISLGADFLGFIQYPKSPRHIDFAQASELLEHLSCYDCKKVLVDVNPEPQRLEMYKQQGFDYFQLHFPCNLAFNRIKSWSEIVGIQNLWLAPKIPPKAGFDAELLGLAEHFLIDAYSDASFGGTGKKSDWGMFSQCQQSHPYKKWILAGGLNVQNAKQAIEILNPDVMDFNSGVETEPGRKDHRKLTDLFRELRG